jgi:hypothetical protein
MGILEPAGIFCLMTAFTLLGVSAASAENHMTGLTVPEPAHTMEGIQFVTGGIGIIERQIMEQMADDYTLQVILAGRSGHYLSRCRVDIIHTDGGKIISTFTDGPWLLVDLPPGKYRVKAAHDHIWKSMDVEVPADRLKQVILNW